MSENKEVSMLSLVGRHVLTGVDFSEQPIKRWSYFEDSQVINFVLDGVTYTAVEDPDDGYRSSMESLYVSDAVVSNQFPPCQVLCVFEDKCSYGEAEILQMIDESTGLIVLEVGTENIDDYYPGFVGNFHPENMAINKAESNE